MTGQSNWRVSFGAFPIAIIGGGHVHTFIRISRPDGTVFAEYHGEPVDENNRRRGDFWSFVPGNHDLHIIRYGGRRPLPDLLPANTRVQDYTLFEGSEEDVMALNDVMRRVEGNFQPVPYIAANPFEEAQNSNSVTATLYGAMRDIGELRGTPIDDIPAQFLDDSVVFTESGRDSYAPGIHSPFEAPRNAAVSEVRQEMGLGNPQADDEATTTIIPRWAHAGGSSNTSTGGAFAPRSRVGAKADAAAAVGTSEQRIDELTGLMTTDPRRYRSGPVQSELRRLFASAYGDKPIVGGGGRTV